MFRNLTRQEKTLINRAFDRWGVYEALADKTLLLQEKRYDGSRRMMICLIAQDLESIVVNTQPDFAGLIIGRLKKQFMPSMAGVDLFARIGQKNKFYITVNENAEKLILYGRDVMGESILGSISDELDENNLVVLLNTRQEAIGIGKTRFSGRLLLENDKVTVTTLVDAGYYLRKEG